MEQPAPRAPTATLRQLPTATAAPGPAVMLPTPTPLVATAPPLPTPTPLSYVIQSGDTLIGIAVKHNVSLEALEAANPGINPGNLQPGQTVLVPPPASEASESTSNPAASLPVTIGTFHCVPTPVAGIICLGEFVNTTDQPVTNLSVRVTLLRSDNSWGDSATAYAPLDLIPPGAAVPLGAIFANEMSGAARTALAAPLTADSGAALAGRYLLLTVSEARGELTPAGFTLTGAVTNPAASEIKQLTIVGSVYNSAGSVIGYRKLTFAEPLAANAGQQFSMTLPGVASPARWAVIAQGRI